MYTMTSARSRPRDCGWPRDRRIEAHVEAQVEHAEPHEERGPYELPPTTQRVGEEGDEETAGDHLDDSADAGREEDCELPVIPRAVKMVGA